GGLFITPCHRISSEIERFCDTVQLTNWSHIGKRSPAEIPSLPFQRQIQVNSSKAGPKYSTISFSLRPFVPRMRSVHYPKAGTTDFPVLLPFTSFSRS